jgi:hypothetical protein
MEVGLEYGWEYWKQKLFISEVINSDESNPKNHCEDSSDPDN